MKGVVYNIPRVQPESSAVSSALLIGLSIALPTLDFLSLQQLQPRPFVMKLWTVLAPTLSARRLTPPIVLPEAS